MAEINESDTRVAQLLAKMCENAIWLLSTAPAPPRRVRMQCGDTVIEAEWAVGQSGPGAAPDTGNQLAEDPEGTGVVHVRSPIVGTFYHAPEPGARPFVSVGEKVEAGQQVGILESMKLMNPIEAEVAGTVVDILVSNASSVEYDEPLIAIEPREP